MKVSAGKRKEILLESFDVIKDNYVDNRVEICELVGKMFKTDIPTAIDMWLYLLDKHKDFVKSDAYHLTDGIIYQGDKAIGEGAIAEIVLSNAAIKRACFALSEDLSYSTSRIICQKIAQDELDVANELLSIAHGNRNRTWSLFRILESSMACDEEISDDAINLLESWIKKVESKEERAKLNVRLLDFMDED